MDDNRAELIRALQVIRLPPEQVCFFDDETAKRVAQHAQDALVEGDNLRWWWTSLKVPHSFMDYPDADGVRHPTGRCPA
jgi:hypothetical protein